MQQVDVSELMDTPDGRDEFGTPDDQIAKCDSCGALYRAGGWHACTDDGAQGDGGAAVADGGHDLPAGWVRVHENGQHKLCKRDGDVEIEITNHCVGISGGPVDRQGWRVNKPAAVGARLASVLEVHLEQAAASDLESVLGEAARQPARTRVLADGSGGGR